MRRQILGIFVAILVVPFLLFFIADFLAEEYDLLDFEAVFWTTLGLLFLGINYGLAHLFTPGKDKKEVRHTWLLYGSITLFTTPPVCFILAIFTIGKIGG